MVVDDPLNEESRDELKRPQFSDGINIVFHIDSHVKSLHLQDE